MPKVSVLMSNYNTQANQLRIALDSVLNQTFTDFEAVIVNDGSVDESKKVLEEYAAKDARIVLVENERNIGLAASLNHGLDVCKGEYVARMDTDDICYPDRLKWQVEYMDEHKNLLFAGAWADVFEDDTENVVETWKPVMCTQDEYHIRLLFGNNPLMIHPTVIFRREYLEKNCLRYDTDAAYKYAEDYRMWVKCSRAGDAGILEKPVIKYRNANSKDRITVRHAEGMRQCNKNNQAEQLKALDIELTDEWFKYHFRLLSGRKDYDIKYKEWINLIIKQNRKKRIYNQKLLKRILHDRWYTITYYGIAYENAVIKRLRLFAGLYTDGKLRFAGEILAKVFRGKR